MAIEKIKIGSKNTLSHSPSGTAWASVDDALLSWNENQFNYPESNIETEPGFRSAQLGALFAIKAHWTVLETPATIVMPTGTGKTEVMIATVVSGKCNKSLIIVPSNLLRKQTVNRFCTLEKLREIGAITDSFKNPVVATLLTSPKDKIELEELIDKSNVIITTMSLLSNHRFDDSYPSMLAAKCDTLIIDEAHHVASNTWKSIKKKFDGMKCLQFTATPFRNDGKKVDGDIIYNFPLALAQERGYFKPINFYPVLEFDDDKMDATVAAKAIELLEADIDAGYPHLLLVRAATQERATELYDKVYQPKYSEHNPVLIVSRNSAAHNKKALGKVRTGHSKIVVCVDMFSEGIDIPQLKICAIHDKYKSIPITIQFIGRFARTQTNLGEASIVANIVDDDISETLEDLYSQDSDWNKILKDTSDEKIGREVELQKLAKDFTGTEVIPLNQLRPKVSMFMYSTTETKWHWKEWTKVFKEENCHHIVNEKAKVLIITELRTSSVDWTVNRDITDKDWNLHILYWNTRKGVFFVNTTDKGIANRFAEAVFNSSKRIVGEDVFRCLSGINRLMLSTVGLKTAISNHHIRYRMFAGVDVAEGITQSTTSAATKSNLFGVGYESGSSMSIGCSYKGTIWAKWVETINYWMEWCNKQADKVLDTSINTTSVLSGALVPEEIDSRPAIVPYRIDFPIEIEEELRGSIRVRTSLHDSRLFLLDIGLSVFDDTSDISFYVGNDDFKEELVLQIDTSGYSIKHKTGDSIKIQVGRSREVTLQEFFQENPPRIWFVDGSSLEGNLLVKLKTATPATFPSDCITAWDWTGVDIRKESQGKRKEADSIQYRLISELKSSGKYSLIFDDDGSGEVSDVIAIQEDATNNRLLFELYHCKFSGADKPGARVDDLYAVCGQAEKSNRWAADARHLIDRLRKRESDRTGKGNPSRFEVGDNKLLFTLKNKLKVYSAEYAVYIVQPGVDESKLTTQMHQVLCSASSYLMDTFGVPMYLICS
ncbi:MAG: DEAD/DEAH box helicase family protein [Clostridium sp.]|jgi:superfamily II DNA or RNA helicase|nr:DEAD/DEAH box helicase family protein [Clostridium sp.]